MWEKNKTRKSIFDIFLTVQFLNRTMEVSAKVENLRTTAINFIAWERLKKPAIILQPQHNLVGIVVSMLAQIKTWLR